MYFPADASRDIGCVMASRTIRRSLRMRYSFKPNKGQLLYGWLIIVTFLLVGGYSSANYIAEDRPFYAALSVMLFCLGLFLFVLAVRGARIRRNSRNHGDSHGDFTDRN